MDNRDEMSFEEFNEQDKYCRENNTPEGCGCTKREIQREISRELWEEIGIENGWMNE